MPNGFWGKILRVDLTSGKIGVDEKDEIFYRTYLGGRGIVAYYLLSEVHPGTVPLGPDNVLVFAPSVLTGTGVPGSARNSVGAKSPLTGGFGEGEGGGDWGVKLRWAGYDALVVTGESPAPVYLWITNNEVEIRDASHLWGLEAYPSQVKIQEEVGDSKASTAVIGPGGERLVRFACINLGTHNFIGRSGLGAVMGAKRLKAVAVSGNLRPSVTDRDGVHKIARWLMDNYEPPLGTMKEMGTARGVAIVNSAGGLPTRNFQEGAFEGFETLTGRYMTDTILVDRESCYVCPVHCKRVVEFEDNGLSVGRDYGGPEYETIGGFGSACGIADIKVVAKANEICNRYSIDTISASVLIAGVMECAERGLLPLELLEGMDLSFGSAEGLLALVEKIGRREGLGDILADGLPAINEKLGEEAARCMMHVKGQPLPLHEPRWKPGMGIGYAISPSGADHMHNIHDPVYSNNEVPAFDPARNLGILEGVSVMELSPAKARLFVYMMLNKSVMNSLNLCAFMPYSLDMIVDQVRSVTGWNFSNWELMKATERALCMARMFNAREGFSAEDDILPDRFFEPLEGGPLKGESLDYSKFYEMRDLIYDMLGWDSKSAAPKPWKLYELGLDWLVGDESSEPAPDVEGQSRLG
jgi:aldehyde:ferredoxin oxidoreductase